MSLAAGLVAGAIGTAERGTASRKGQITRSADRPNRHSRTPGTRLHSAFGPEQPLRHIIHRLIWLSRGVWFHPRLGVWFRESRLSRGVWFHKQIKNQLVLQI